MSQTHVAKKSAKSAQNQMQKARLEHLLFNTATRLQNWAAQLAQGEKPALVVLELGGGYAQFSPRKFPDVLLNRAETLEDLEDKLELLAGCDWVKGVIFRVGELGLDWTKAYSVRRAIAKLGQTKSTYALFHSADMRSYFAFSSAQQLSAPESAILGLYGLSITQTYMRDALGKLGIEFEALAIREYKSAVSTFTQQEMTEHQREQLERLMASLLETFCSEVAQSRKMTAEQVKAALEGGISSAQAAQAAGLLDRVAYEDELLGEMHHPYSEAVKFITAPLLEGISRVAVVALEGDIVVGHSRRGGLPIIGGNAQAGSESLIRALRLAEEDESSKAIVLFVNSGGGSALASDLIGREVKRIAQKKPVVAVMGAVAASGGYYVLTHAQHVIAAPTTITGSIGVVTGKLNLELFDAQFGFNAQTVKTSPYADLFDSHQPLGAERRALLERDMDEIYDRFISRVAEGRNLSKERVNELGRGRIWTGSDALERGLIDELGTLERGIAKAKELAGLPYGAAHWMVDVPKQMILPKEGQGMLEWLAPVLRDRIQLRIPFGIEIKG
jgi:protease IV